MTAVMSLMLRQFVMPRSVTKEAFQMSNDLFHRENNLSEAQARVKLIAWHGCEPGESVKAAIRRVAMATGLPFNTVRRWWYGLPGRVDAWALDILRAKTGYARDAQKQLAELRRRHFPVGESDSQLCLELDRCPPRRDG